jgi:hypothetical protein
LKKGGRALDKEASIVVEFNSWLRAAVGSLALFGSQAAMAAPLTYDCDTAAGSFSPVEQVQSGPSYSISARLTPRLSRTDKRWLPAASLGVGKPGQEVLLRVFAEERGGKNFKVSAIYSGDGEPKQAELGGISMGQSIGLAIYAEPGTVRVTAGGKSTSFAVTIAPNASVSASCSTGEFLFEALELAPPAGR